MSAPDEAGRGARRLLTAALAVLAVIAIAAGLAVQIVAVVLAAHGAADTSANVLAGQLVTQSGALAAKTNTQLVLACLGLQAVAALLIAGGSARLMPARYRTPRIPLFGYLWVMNFAVPFGGLLCTLCALAVGTKLPRRERYLPIQQVFEPEFAPNLRGTVSYGRGARLKAELQNADLDTSFRMTALIAMQSMPARTVSPLLQSMLADPLDDIRLLAYGILDNREKGLTQRILAERARLDGKSQPAATGDERRLANKELAGLYSELIYEQLVKGDVYRNAAEQADAYASAALEADPSDASLWRLRGRLALDQRNLDMAEEMLQRAIDCGFPRERMLPYLAEVAYQRRDYARVRELLAEVEQHGSLPTLRAVLDYWHAPRETPTL
ncbi:tetratricopeptide repeat protein [Paraburkholderia dinghuensis]|uniref:Sugar ABC transporter permease n=1 Tax=Paraburkholderia dinghuensis TaxID=2305225 RepID=A0A3N6N899_9BURK|nr:sugar ABC transporter permease [Paraburkholderia dinghuensis]RQH07101.1 sugar ABC transporter permease [Paraburkholderia dinghuensis]